MMRGFLFTAGLAVLTAVTAKPTVVVDSVSGSPIANASIFDNRGKMAGVCSSSGRIPYISPERYPLTVRSLGFMERTITLSGTDTLRMQEMVYDLPEVEVRPGKDQILHLLAYVRDYSSLSSYSDTVSLFREKWVDFMIPAKDVKSYRGWLKPRILSSRSYYQFSNADGLDSVSDRFNQHFSWSDWLDVINRAPLPLTLRDTEAASDTVFGKYSAAEIWRRNGDNISLHLDVLADTATRRWVPNLSSFLRDDISFEKVDISYDYRDVVTDSLYARDLNGIALNIESKGRGRKLFRFARRDEPCYISTYAEVYIADKEYLSVHEAKEYERRRVMNFDPAQLPLPPGVPPLHHSTERLIARVNDIDTDATRVALNPDKKVAGIDLEAERKKPKLLKLLKHILH